jgi:hypothetical protein
MLGAGVAGAGIGALGGAVTGRDPLQMGLYGGLGGAAAAGLGVGAAGAGGAGVGTGGGVGMTYGSTGAASGLTAGAAPGSIVAPSVAGAGANLGAGTMMTPAANAMLGGGAALTPAAASIIPGISNTALGIGAGGLGLMALMNQEQKKYGIPSSATTPYTGGNLANFKYDPRQYNPDVVRPPNPPYQAQYRDYTQNPYVAAQGGMVPGYADGGLLDPNSEPVDFMGGDMYPQSQQQRSYYATPTQMPTSAQQTAASYEPNTNPLTGEMTANMAGGGLTSLGSYSDGGQMLRGPGDGMSDSIPARIGSRQPARLADNEFVVPADVVSHLGNGSSDAGAKKLYAMMNSVRKARTGKKKQAPKINADKYLPA